MYFAAPFSLSYSFFERIRFHSLSNIVPHTCQVSNTSFCFSSSFDQLIIQPEAIVHFCFFIQELTLHEVLYIKSENHFSSPVFPVELQSVFSSVSQKEEYLNIIHSFFGLLDTATLSSSLSVDHAVDKFTQILSSHENFQVVSGHRCVYVKRKNAPSFQLWLTEGLTYSIVVKPSFPSSSNFVDEMTHSHLFSSYQTEKTTQDVLLIKSLLQKERLAFLMTTK